MPMMPISPSLRKISAGNVWLRSQSLACGAISRAANAATVSRTARCSSVKSKCIAPPDLRDFDEQRVALPAAAADRGDAESAAAAAQRVDEVRDDTCPACTERV